MPWLVLALAAVGCAIHVEGFGVGASVSVLDGLVEDGDVASSPDGAAGAIRGLFHGCDDDEDQCPDDDREPAAD